MFHKKRDQSSLTVKISTFTFTTTCFVSKRCIYLINYHLGAFDYGPKEDMCIGPYVLKRRLNVWHILEKVI